MRRINTGKQHKLNFLLLYLGENPEALSDSKFPGRVRSSEPQVLESGQFYGETWGLGGRGEYPGHCVILNN